jgi:hypothetical protein
LMLLMNAVHGRDHCQKDHSLGYGVSQTSSKEMSIFL